MATPSLKDVEKTLTALWTQRDALDSFLEHDSNDLNQDIVTQLDTNRILIYRNTVHAGQQEAMRTIFPLSAWLLAPFWKYITDDYVEQHPPTHFQPSKMGARFPDFAARELLPRYRKSYPYLVELADYEWTEMMIIDMETEPPVSDLKHLESPEQFSNFSPVVNETVQIKNYSYPVLKIVAQLEGEKRPKNVVQEETHVIIYRDPGDNECRKLALGAVAAALIESAKHRAVSYNQLCELAVQLNPEQTPQETVSYFLTLLEGLRAKNIVLGHRRI